MLNNFILGQDEPNKKKPNLMQIRLFNGGININEDIIFPCL